jgi:hypothetical protein
MPSVRCLARWSFVVAAPLCLAVPGAVSVAQPLGGDKPAAAIVDSDIRQEETLSRTEAGKVITAINRIRENIGMVRKTTKLNTVDIVFLTDAARSEGGPPPAIESKVKQHKDDVAELRREIEANALLFNAIDSRRVLAEDVLAVEFDNPGRIVIYAAAKPPK